MPNVATIGTRFTGDNVDFIRKIEEAEKRAQTFGGRVESALTGVFKKTPGRRAELAISNLIGDITSGNATQGIAQFAGRITGLGLGAGLAIGATVEIFQKLHAQIKAASDASKELGLSLSRLGGTRGPEEISKQFEEISTQTAMLVKESSTFGNKVGNALDKITETFTGTRGSGHAEDQSSMIAAGLRAQAVLLEKRNAAESDNLLVKGDEIRLGKSEADLAKVTLDLARKKSDIDEAFIKYKQSFFQEGVVDKFEPKERDRLITQARAAAENQKNLAEGSAAMETAQIEKGEAAQKRNYEMQLKIANLQGEKPGLTSDMRRRGQAGLELQEIIQRQIGATPDEARGLRIERINKENEIRNLLPPKFAAGTIAARNAEDAQGGYGTLAGRANEMNDPSAYGSLAYNAVQRGENPVPKGDISSQEVLAEVKGFNARMDKYWGPAK